MNNYKKMKKMKNNYQSSTLVNKITMKFFKMNIKSNTKNLKI